jgi:hypothetical protein
MKAPSHLAIGSVLSFALVMSSSSCSSISQLSYPQISISASSSSFSSSSSAISYTSSYTSIVLKFRYLGENKFKVNFELHVTNVKILVTWQKTYIDILALIVRQNSDQLSKTNFFVASCSLMIPILVSMNFMSSVHIS